MATMQAKPQTLVSSRWSTLAWLQTTSIMQASKPFSRRPANARPRNWPQNQMKRKSCRRKYKRMSLRQKMYRRTRKKRRKNRFPVHLNAFLHVLSLIGILWKIDLSVLCYILSCPCEHTRINLTLNGVLLLILSYLSLCFIYIQILRYPCYMYR